MVGVSSFGVGAVDWRMGVETIRYANWAQNERMRCFLFAS